MKRGWQLELGSKGRKTKKEEEGNIFLFSSPRQHFYFKTNNFFSSCPKKKTFENENLKIL